MSGGSGARIQMMQQQALTSLGQVAPVQNTWYTLLDTTKNCRVIDLSIVVADANETLEVRLTIDGQTITASQAAVAGTGYMLAFDAGNSFAFVTSIVQNYRAFLVEGRSIKIDFRKTTATGAGTITAWVNYQKIP